MYTYFIIVVNILLAVTTSWGKIACSVLVMLLNTLVYIISVVTLTVAVLKNCTSASSSINSVLRQLDTFGEAHMPLSKHLLVVCKSVYLENDVKPTYIQISVYSFS